MDRRKFFSDGLRDLFRDLMQSPVGRAVDRQLHGISNVLDPRGLDYMIEQSQPRDPLPEDHYARPPGALPDPDAFEKACTKCGDCETACPYGTIFQLDFRSGPLVNPESVPCHLCVDYPCIQACQDGALLPLQADEVPRFGQARLVQENCVNHPDNKYQRRRDSAGRQRHCTECKQACPVQGVVKYNAQKFPQFADFCTGCGLCAAACPALSIAIRIDPDIELTETE
ncbi:MAG: 4Fe-4S binding protein [Leptospiraceae bacterium]|nr:4Fe-4S binding protein [Leptospiraceae bacterium]MCB1321764.1 4Fe-4S binding protein [Leptospiraceae bacterium]